MEHVQKGEWNRYVVFQYGHWNTILEQVEYGKEQWIMVEHGTGNGRTLLRPHWNAKFNGSVRGVPWVTEVNAFKSVISQCSVGAVLSGRSWGAV